jgi:C4-dicarboxylate-specific signal transduction histidine kinase
VTAAEELHSPRLEGNGGIKDIDRLQAEISRLEAHLQQGVERRRAMLHIMGDLANSNKRLNDQRRAMLHILVDYERDRKNLAEQTERLNNSRRALVHILSDAHESNVRLGLSRKAMIHIMGDLRRTTEEIRQREQELTEKQEQLVQAAKLATLGELTTGIAHELNNPLNNIGLFIGNVLDRIRLGQWDEARMEHDLSAAMLQVDKATEIITHLRTFGRAAPVSRESVSINQVAGRALSLLREQFRLRQVQVELELAPEEPRVTGNPIQLEQVVMNLLTNARDAIADSPLRRVSISSQVIEGERVRLVVADSGPGIPGELQQRVFDPFFTTKEVGEGTGLGLSIVYGIVQDHDGTITVESPPGQGASFVVELPRERDAE